ncbi:MAG: hypothetical protein ACI9U2_001964, partial [Bradymonadia bacterium]
APLGDASISTRLSSMTSSTGLNTSSPLAV